MELDRMVYGILLHNRPIPVADVKTGSRTVDPYMKAIRPETDRGRGILRRY
jgi:hypothetical protein